MVFPVISDECPPSPLPFLESWRGKYIVFSEVPPNTPEADVSIWALELDFLAD